ncbi:MAG: hypothetical protein ACRC6I_15040 [Paracoccaceae bacterium]
MKHWTIGTGITLGAILMGSTAFAQVAPEDLWTKFQEFAAASGQTVTTESVNRNGDTLEVRGLVFTVNDPMNTVTQTIAELNFKDNGDGTVGITMSDTIPFTMKSAGDPSTGVPASSMDMTVVQNGLMMKASGTAAAPFIDFTATSVNAKGTMTDPNGATNIDVTMNNMAGGYAFTDNDFQYNYTSGAGNISVANPTMPFPINIGFGEMGFDMKFPLKTSAEPVPFTFLMKLVDFTLPPEVWGMADPTGQLPQDPATLIIDTAGSIRLMADFTATPAAGEVPPPPELHSLSIRDLQLKMLGTALAGSGDLTFDLTDTTTFGGVPAPTGTLDFKLDGGNGLLDKLAAMGMIPEDQLMGTRMMMGMFATMATDGSDSMTSKVEFRDKGLFVNGQQLQ